MQTSRKLHAAVTGVLVSLFALIHVGGGRQERDVKKLAQVETAASSTMAVPGKPVTIAVKFTIAPHWHIYWHNPGDSGMATGLNVKAPPGWKVSNWRFPLPKKFEQTGGLVGYGYEGEAVFLADVTPPADFAGEAKLDVETVFLVCEDVCLPGNEPRSIKLVAGPTVEATPGWISEWESRVPLRFDGQVTTKGVLSGAWSAFEVALGGTSKSWSGVEIFPLAGDDVEVRNIQASVGNLTGNGGSGEAPSATIRFEAKKYGQDVVPPASISLLAVFTTADGRKVGRWIDVPSGVPVGATTGVPSGGAALPSTQPSNPASTGVPSK